MRPGKHLRLEILGSPFALMLGPDTNTPAVLCGMVSVP